MKEWEELQRQCDLIRASLLAMEKVLCENIPERKIRSEKARISILSAYANSDKAIAWNEETK